MGLLIILWVELVQESVDSAWTAYYQSTPAYWRMDDPLTKTMSNTPYVHTYVDIQFLKTGKPPLLIVLSYLAIPYPPTPSMRLVCSTYVRTICITSALCFRHSPTSTNTTMRGHDHKPTLNLRRAIGGRRTSNT